MEISAMPRKCMFCKNIYGVSVSINKIEDCDRKDNIHKKVDFRADKCKETTGVCDRCLEFRRKNKEDELIGLA